MSVGFIKIHRALFDNWVADEPEALAVWVRILSEANFKDKKKKFNGALLEVKRGQLIFGLDAFSKRSGVSVRKLRRIIDDLESDGMIVRQRTNRYSLITVLSYDNYQDASGQSQASDKPVTSQGQSNVNQTAAPKEVKKGKKVIKKYSADDLAVSEWIYEKLLAINPDHKKPDMNKWADAVRLMREADKRTHKDICRVFAWANQDPFWSTNILSPASLRKSFDKLSIKASQPVIIKSTLFSDGNGFDDETDYIDHAPMGYIEHG